MVSSSDNAGAIACKAPCQTGTIGIAEGLRELMKPLQLPKKGEPEPAF
jgi:hypothetical protein